MADQPSHPEEPHGTEEIREADRLSPQNEVTETGQLDTGENDISGETLQENLYHQQAGLEDDEPTGSTVNGLALQIPKPALEDITEETEGGEGSPNIVGEYENHGYKSPNGQSEHTSPYASRRQSAKPKSRAGIGSRGRWTNEVPESTESFPNTDSTVYSPGERSVGYEIDSPDHWNAPIGSPIRSQWSSPMVTPIGEAPLDIGQRSRSRVQVKDHGPVAKWLAKRTKKSKSAPEKLTKSQSKAKGKNSGVSSNVRSQYAPYIQPKVNSHNAEYERPVAEPAPILSEKLKWHAKPVVSTHNEFFKEPQEKKPLRLLNEKLHWDPVTKVDVWNRDYTPVPAKPFKVFSEKLKWNQHSKIDNQTEDYSAPFGHSEIFNEPPNWRSHAKIDTYNKNYVKPAKSTTPVFHETTQWKAKPKVDNLQPHYKPSGGGNIRVKTDRLNWKSEPKVDTFHPRYQSTKPPEQPFNSNNKVLWNTTAKVEHGGNTKDTNGWSSHSSDTETEWLSMSPGGSEKHFPHGKTHKTNVKDRSRSQQEHNSYSPEKFNWSERRVLFNSKDVIDDEGFETYRSYPQYKSQSGSLNDQNKKKNPVFTRHKPELRNNPKPVKAKKLFKERVDPLPPIGTYTHKVDEPVVYPENGGAYYGQPNRGNNPNASRSQKIEVIDMKELALLSKRGRQSVFIN